jgi:hypothetical protein
MSHKLSWVPALSGRAATTQTRHRSEMLEVHHAAL